MPDIELDDGSVIIDWTTDERIDALLKELNGPHYGMGDITDHAIWTIKALRKQVALLEQQVENLEYEVRYET